MSDNVVYNLISLAMLNRRDLLGGVLWTASRWPKIRNVEGIYTSEPDPTLRTKALTIRALTFDVFGTITDWRSAVIRDGSELSRKEGCQLDWNSFAEQWRAGYWIEMNRVRRGEIPWVKLDLLHRHTLDRLLQQFKCDQLREPEKEWLNLVWHRLPAWPDVKPALARLRQRFVAAPLSNANIAMMVDISRYAGLTWDCVLSAELAHHFKPEREAYLTAAALLDVKPSEILMVAVHFDDLAGAHAAGLRTAYLHRPKEHGPGYAMPPRPPFAFDFEVRDLTELCDQLGV
jgi:2-haloacid dehalogenase